MFEMREVCLVWERWIVLFVEFSNIRFVMLDWVRKMEWDVWEGMLMGSWLWVFLGEEEEFWGRKKVGEGM